MVDAKILPGAISHALIQFVVNQHHALRGEQHRRAQREHPRAHALQAWQHFLRHRDMVGEQEAGVVVEDLLADQNRGQSRLFSEVWQGEVGRF